MSVRHKGPDRKQNADMPERHIRITSSMSVSATVSPYVGIIQIRFTGLGDTSHSQPACASSPIDKGYHSTIRPGLQGIFPDTGEIGQFSPLCADCTETAPKKRPSQRKFLVTRTIVFSMAAVKRPLCDPARSSFGGVDKFPPRVYICIQVYSKRIAGKEPAMLELSAKPTLLEENDYR